MKKFIFVLFFVILSTVVFAQTLFVESDNISVTGAVAAELMYELRSENAAVIGNRFICHQVDAQYIIAIDLHSYNVVTTTIYNILQTKPYWVNNLRMVFNNGSNEIQVTYSLNGRNYLVKIGIVFPG